MICYTMRIEGRVGTQSKEILSLLSFSFTSDAPRFIQYTEVQEIEVLHNTKFALERMPGDSQHLCLNQSMVMDRMC